jgi:ABC-type uncharacterized transport system permease subunit
MSGLDLSAIDALLAGTLRLATPVALAALGETIVERSGTINLGIEGTMALGAIAAIIAAGIGGWPLGLAAALVVGALVGLGMASAVLKGGANQVVVGIALSLIAGGLATYLYQVWDAAGLSDRPVALVPVIPIPILADVPLLGAVFNGQSALTWATALLIGVTALVLSFTRAGLQLIAVGDHPDSAAALGLRVERLRTIALAIGGALGGLAGASLTLGYLGTFTDGIVGGRGYVALAIVIIGRWSPVGAALGALLFALFDSLALRAQGGGLSLPVEAFESLPYLVTLLVLVLSASRAVAPRALGVPYRPER